MNIKKLKLYIYSNIIACEKSQIYANVMCNYICK